MLSIGILSDGGVRSDTIFKKKNNDTREVRTSPILSPVVTNASMVKA